jgi:hypothetical protein
MAKKDKWIKRWSVESFTNPDQKYNVAVDREGNHGCSCPAWRFQRKTNPICKHIHFVIRSTDRERAALLVRQYRIDVLPESEWKVFLIKDETGEQHVAVTRNFGDRE